MHGLPVLVVDDNATNRRILEEMLINWGMWPTLVDGGPQALDALEQARRDGTPFALILLDAMMPEMDGFMLAERIRQGRECVGATLMMLSSANRREDAARCRELGVASYLTKPVRQSTLLDAILTRRLEGAADAGTRQPPGGTVPRGRPLRLLLAEDNPVNQRLAVGLLGEARARRRRGGRRARGGRGARAGDLRRGADGRPDAGDGRLRGDRRDPPSRGDRRAATSRSSP